MAPFAKKGKSILASVLMPLAQFPPWQKTAVFALITYWWATRENSDFVEANSLTTDYAAIRNSCVLSRLQAFRAPKRGRRSYIIRHMTLTHVVL